LLAWSPGRLLRLLRLLRCSRQERACKAIEAAAVVVVDDVSWTFVSSRTSGGTCRSARVVGYAHFPCAFQILWHSLRINIESKNTARSFSLDSLILFSFLNDNE